MYLEKVFKQIKGDVCLLGGWSAHHIVNKNFEIATGHKYIGSRDIDIGFHIDKGWSKEELMKSDFSAAISLIEQIGFWPISFRLAKDFELETGRELTTSEAAKLPLHQIFQLYVDPVVDFIHPKIKQLFGFIPIDEPLLSLVFLDRLYTIDKLFGRDILLPRPHVLLAMKLNSVINRDKEHKRIKDISDIFALLWFSNVKIAQLKASLFSIYPKLKARKTVRSFTVEEIDMVSKVIGVSKSEIKRVLSELE
jgi:hypothetical protein